MIAAADGSDERGLPAVWERRAPRAGSAASPSQGSSRPVSFLTNLSSLILRTGMSLCHSAMPQPMSLPTRAG